jgi:hypothetical protein
MAAVVYRQGGGGENGAVAGLWATPALTAAVA